MSVGVLELGGMGDRRFGRIEIGVQICRNGWFVYDFVLRDCIGDRLKDVAMRSRVT